MAVHRGSCLCGAVRFEVDGALAGPDACHCGMCRKVSGHFFASTDVKREVLTLQGGEHVTWYQSSAAVRRGFCGRCGSSLFWDKAGKDWIGVAMGAFDGATETALAVHIFVGEKGDYYEIGDGVRQFERAPV